MKITHKQEIKRTYDKQFPLKCRIFFNAEISIYSRAEFCIYLFEDFLRRTVSVDFSHKCSKTFYKTNKSRYLNKRNEKSRAGINGYFYVKNPLLWECHFHKLPRYKMMTSCLSTSFFPLVQ